MAVFLESRKKDQFKEGSWMFVSRWKGGLCPVALTEQLLEQGHQTRLAPLLGRIRSLGEKQMIWGIMSYSRARVSVRTAFASADVSLAAAAGVPDRLIQRHGGWKSEGSDEVLLC